MSAPFYVIGPITDTSIVEDAAGNYTLTRTFTFGDASPTDFHGLDAIDATTGHPTYGVPRGALTATILDDAEGGTDTGTIEWVYTLSNSIIQDLAEGETRIERFRIPIVDAQSNTTHITIDVTVTGTNDAPIFSTPSPTLGFTEDSSVTLSDSGTLTFNDVDIIDTHTVSMAVAATGITTGLALDNGQLKALLTATADSTAALSNGSVNWSFSAANTNFDFLDQGQVLTLTYTLTLDDAHAGTGTRTVTVNITGTNDVATIAVADQSNTESDAPAVVNFNIADYVTITDKDAPDAASPMDYVSGTGSLVAAGPTPPMITFDNVSGAVSYDRNAFNYLDAGESVTYTFTFQAQSGDDAAQTKTLVLNINGQNDVATITTVNQTDSENDTSIPVAFNIASYVTISDADASDAASPVNYVANSGSVAALGPVPPAGTLASLVTFDANTGTVAYDRDAFNWLDGDQSVTYTFSFDAQSGNDAAQSKTLTLTINGANDPGTITVTNPANDTEANASAPVTITIADQVAITDPDKQDADNAQDYVTGTASLLSSAGAAPPVGTLAGLVTINPALGTISYDRASFNYLATGEAVTYTVAFDSQSGDDGFVPQTLMFTITGENDAPTVAAGGTTTGGITEPLTGNYNLANANLSGSFSFSDADASDTLTVSAAGGTLVWSATGAAPAVGVLSAAQQAAILSAFSISTTGNSTVNWAFDTATTTNVNLNFLALNETLTATFNLTAADGHGGSVTQPVTITFTGTNDAPSTSGTRTATATEGSTATAITGTTAGTRINFTDPDLSDDGHTFTITPTVLGLSTGPTAVLTPAQLAQFLTLPTINQSGAAAGGNVHWSFSAPNNTFDFLAAGETLVVQYAVTASDGTASGGGGTVTVTIIGTNDVPTITMTTTAVITADEAGGVANGDAGTQEVSGDASSGGANWVDLDVNEDSGHAITHGSFGGNAQALLLFTGGTGDEAVITGTYGTLFLKANGAYRYVLDNNSAATQALDDASVPTEVFNYTIANVGAGTAISTITINVSGSNDAPVLSAITPPAGVIEALNASVQDLSLSGSLSVADVDAGDTLTASAGTVNVLLNGLAPAIAVPTPLLSGLSFTGTPNSSSGTAQTINWTYDPAAANLDFLAEGDTLTISFPVTVSDGTTASNAQPIVITITGTNDQPIVTAADLSGGVTEDATAPNLADSGTIDFTDVDHSDLLTVTAAIERTPATTSVAAIPAALLTALNSAFTVSGDGTGSPAHNGTITWNFTLANSLAQYLAVGEEVTATYRVTINDGSGALNDIRYEDVTVTITGTNDAPVITAGGVATGSVSEPNGTPGATPSAINGSFAFTDADATDEPGSGGAAILGSSLSVTPGTLTAAQISAAGLLSSAFTTSLVPGATNSGTIDWSFAPAAGALDFLREAQTASLVFTVTIADGNGGTAARDVTIALSGTNDVITHGAAVDDDTGIVTEPSDATTTVSTTGTVDFRDADLTGNPVIVTRNDGTSTLPAGNKGTLTQAITSGPDASGLRTLTWTYENSHANLNYLGAGDSLTDVFNIRVLDQSSGGFLNFPVTITVHGTNDAPVLSAVSIASPVPESAGDSSTQDFAAINGTITVSDVDTGGIAADAMTASASAASVTLTNGSGTSPFALPGTASALIDSGALTFGAPALATGVNQNISWTYDPGAANLDFLGLGDTLTITYTVKVNDGNADSSTLPLVITITGTNDQPTITAETGLPVLADTAAADTFANVTGSLDGADLDQNTALAYSLDTGEDGIGAFGTLTVNANGTYTYVVDATAVNALQLGNHTDVFQVRALDGDGGFATTTLTINVNAANDTPVITAQTGAPTLVDTGTNNTFANVTGTLTSMDRDTGASASFSLTSGEDGIGTYGTLTVNSDGTYSFVANAAVINALQAGSFTDVFDVQVDDGLGGVAASTLTFNITAGNDTPEITAVIGTPTLADAPGNDSFANITGTLTSGDRDTGATATYGLGGGEDGVGTYGTLSVAANGDYTFVANAAAINGLQSGSASDVFDVQVDDGQGGVATTTITINVTGANDTPEITAEVGTPTLVDTAASNTFANVTGQLDATDRDAGHTLTYSLGTLEDGIGSYGSLTVNGDGTYTYVPNAVAINALGIGNATDVFDVRVSDGQGGTATTILTINVNGSNDTPVAVADVVAPLGENTGVSVSVLTNDTDADTVDGKSLVSINTLTALNVTGLGTLSPADLATLNGYFSANTGTGQVEFTPGAGLPGATESIFDRLDAGETATITLTYTMQDTAAAQSTTTVTFTINGAKEIIVGTAGDDIAVPISGTAYGDDIDGLGGDDIINSGQGNDIIVGGSGADQINSGSENDTITGGQGDDNIDGATGTDTAIFSGSWANYAISQSAPATFTIADQRLLQDGSDLVQNVENFTFSNGTFSASVIADDAPVAAGDSGFTVSEDGSITIAKSALLANDTDADIVAGLGDSLSINVVGGASTGAVVIDGANIVFTPGPNFNGAASFTYTVSDIKGLSSVATVNVTVTAVNDAPTGTPTAVLANGTEDVAYTVNASDLLAGYSDVDGDILSVANLVSSSGSVTNNGNGTFTISAPADANGPVTLTYDVTDGNGGTLSVQTRSFSRAAVNDAPTGTPAAVLANGTEDVAYTVNGSDLLAGFSDVEGNTLSVANLLSSSGSVTNNGDGTFTISAPLNANGLVTLTYDVTDGNGGTLSGQTRSFTRAAVNDAPTGVVAILGAAVEDQILTALNTLADVEGLGTISYQWKRDGGTISGATGSSYTLVDADVGSSITVTASYTDLAGNLEQITSGATSNVANVNDGPISIALSNATVNEYAANGTTVGTLSNVDVDGPGPFTYTIVSQSVSGAFIVTGDSLKVSDFTKLDFEQVSLASHSVTVRVDDGVGGQRDQTFVISAIDRSPENVTGSSGNNIFVGGAGNDTFNGGAGSDTLSGGGGLDRLTGGLGRDVMTGGALRDVFDFNFTNETGKTGATRDLIKDFQHLVDDIDLSTIDANSTLAGNQAFSFLALKGAAFTGVAGQLHWLQIDAAGTVNDKTIIEGDINGDRVVDFQIELTGLKTLTASDFIV